MPEEYQHSQVYQFLKLFSIGGCGRDFPSRQVCYKFRELFQYFTPAESYLTTKRSASPAFVPYSPPMSCLSHRRFLMILWQLHKHHQNLMCTKSYLKKASIHCNIFRDSLSKNYHIFYIKKIDILYFILLN